MLDPLIERFTDQILEEANLTSLPDEFRNQFKLQMAEEIQKRMGILTLQALSDENLKAFDQLMTQEPESTPEVMAQFFKEKIPNYDEFIAGKIIEFKDEFVQKAKSIHKK